MKIIVIGAVAAGTAAATQARRNSETAEIIIYEKDEHFSYSACGIPYALQGEIDSEHKLYPRTPDFFKFRYNIHVRTNHEVLSILSSEKKIEIKNLENNQIFYDSYDRLIVATGASPNTPLIPGITSAHVFALRTINHMLALKKFISEQQPKTAVIIGSGAIGMEMTESLYRLGLQVTVVEKSKRLFPSMDPEFSEILQKHLEKNNINVLTHTEISEISKNYIIVNKEKIPADLVLNATGVHPSTTLAKNTGIRLGKSGAVIVDQTMRTNLPNIFACGDCIETYYTPIQENIYRPQGSVANKTGYIAGDQASGGNLTFNGIQGSSIFRIFDMTFAQTGLTETEIKKRGIQSFSTIVEKPERAPYMNGKDITLKISVDQNKKLLGAQAAGGKGIDKRIDILTTALFYKATTEELLQLDLAYAPPYSMVRDPIHYAAMILENLIRNKKPKD